MGSIVLRISFELLTKPSRMLAQDDDDDTTKRRRTLSYNHYQRAQKRRTYCSDETNWATFTVDFLNKEYTGMEQIS